MAYLTRTSRGLLAMVFLLAVSGIACAGTSQRGPRVVWVRGDRVYVASPDSVALDPGTILAFKDRGKEVATGEVTAVHDRELIVAELTSGSLAKVKHPEKLEVTADRSDLRPQRLLRVGYPAPGRRNLLFDCPYQSIDSSLLLVASRRPPLQRFYKTEVLDGRSYRLVRDTTVTVAVPWPDTLLVRCFDEVADEEIALERGDLDAAVFWPGEASAHIRKVTGWTQQFRGIGARGWLTATERSYLPSVETSLREDEISALELLKRELFRNDLAIVELAGRSELTAPRRFEVDASLPGHETMERFLNRAIGGSVPVDTARVLHVSYKEIWPRVPEVCLTGQCLLVVRCPVISGPKLRPFLDALDLDALANLFQCLPSPRKP